MNKALGKGLSALIPDSVDEKSEDIARIATELIEENSLQPRTNYDDDKLGELKNSIKEKGILQPILVRRKGEKYEVVAGERRLRVARELELEDIPAVIRDVTDQEALVMALIENIQREELNPIEEAEAFKRLIDEFQYTQDTVAQAVGKDRTTITNLLRLLNLPDNIKKSVYEGQLSAGHARALLAIESFNEQTNLYKKALTGKISVRELENLVNKISKGPRRKKGEAKKDPQIVALEEKLQQLLGTKVTVAAKKKRGKIIIDYYSHEELNRIVKTFIQ